MTDYGALHKSPLDRDETVKAPTPPPLDEPLWKQLARGVDQFRQKTLQPLADSTDAGVRAAANTATFGTADKLESAFGVPGGGPASSELTSARTQQALKEHGPASTLGSIGGAAAQAALGGRLLGMAVPELGAAGAVPQAINQGILGGTQSAAQNIYESVRDDKKLDTGSLGLSTLLGTVLGAGSGALSSKLAGMTAAGKVAQTLPERLSPAELTAIGQQMQRAATAGAPIDLATAMRLAGQRQAPVVERQIQRGTTARTGERLDVVPPGLGERLTQTRGALSESEATTSRELAERLAQQQRALTEANEQTSRSAAGQIRQQERDVARLGAVAANERAPIIQLSGRTSPRIEEVRKQIMEEGRLGLNPNPPKGFSPDIYEETYRRLIDMGEVGEAQRLRAMMDRGMPASVPHRQATERLTDLQTNGLPPSPESLNATEELRRLREMGLPPSEATTTARGQLRDLQEIEGAITTRPVAPEPPKGTRPREIQLGSWGSGGPSFLRYRGAGGPAAPGPTVERAARMFQDNPEAAARMIGNAIPGQVEGGILGAEALRPPLETLTDAWLGVSTPQPKKRKAQ